MTERTCSVDGCEKPHYGKGWCVKHYTRMRRYGTLVVPGSREAAPPGSSWCGDCRIFKPLAEFYRHSGTSNGVHTYCKACHRDRNRKNWDSLPSGRRREYRERAKEGRLDAARRRRVRILGGSVEKFGRYEIAQRDGWTCQLCGEPIPAGEVWPHPLSFSIDHVVPVSGGGAHTRKNVQAAHLRCNVSKGSGGSRHGVARSDCPPSG